MSASKEAKSISVRNFVPWNTPTRICCPWMESLQPSKKPLMGTPIPLHLLHQAAQRCLVHTGIAKQVFDPQIKAFIIRRQRSQQPFAQTLIQRGRTAQGKNDLLFLPDHSGVLHDHTAKAGGKVRVGHKLRPKLGYERFHKGFSCSRSIDK